MRKDALPNRARTVVSEQKIVNYLLSETHADGRGKARFFSGFGFLVSDWQTLAAALRRHGAENPLVETVETAFGVRYVVEGQLHAPDGRRPTVRSVWFVERDGDAPKLVTAYPIKQR